MANLIQKEDLSSQDFTNDNTLAAGGVHVRKSALATIAAGVPAFTPAPNDPVDYYNKSTSPWQHYHWDGLVWNLVGDGVGGAGSDGVVNSATLSAANILSLGRTIGAPVTVDLSTLANGPAGGANLTYTATPTNGTVFSDSGTDAIIPLASTVNSGLAPPRSGVATDYLSGTGVYLPLPTAAPKLAPKGAPITITASGTYTPTGTDVVAINVEMCAGGGGVPSVTNTQSDGARATSGGTGGGYCQKFIWGPAPATIVIGAAGAAASLLAGQGGQTSYVSGLYSMIAHGGLGGLGVGGAAATSPEDRLRSRTGYHISLQPSGGDVNIPGGVGGTAIAFGGASNGGFTNATGGFGGTNPMGVGGYAESWYASGGTFAGQAGGLPTGFGAGAGGSTRVGVGTSAGALGGAGAVIIQEYISIP